MITYDEIKAASENLEREYTDEIRPLLLEVVKAFNTLYMPYLNKQTVGLANAHKRKDLVSIPSFSSLCPTIGRSVDKDGVSVPPNLYALHYWISTKIHAGEGTVWDYMLSGRVSLPSVSDMIIILKMFKGYLDKIRTEHRLFVDKLPSLARGVETNLAALKELENAEDAEFHSLFGVKEKTQKKIRVTVIVEEV